MIEELIFSGLHSPSHDDFTSVSCERRTLNSLVCSYCSWACPCWLCSLEADLPRAPVWAQVSCDAGFPHELRPQRPHGLDLRGQPGSILTVTGVKQPEPPAHTWAPGVLCYHHLIYSLPQHSLVPFVSVLIILFFTISGSSLFVFGEEADPGEGEESPWLLQGDKGDPGYDDIELSAPGTSTVTFPWCCIKYEMKPQIF